MESFFEVYFNLLDPVGVEERSQYNRRVEEDAIGLEINYMGSLLVTDVEDFHRRMGKEPSDVSAELVAIAGMLHPVPFHSEPVMFCLVQNMKLHMYCMQYTQLMQYMQYT